MKEQEYILRYKVYSNQLELSSQDQSLLDYARAAIAKAYAPYSKFRVGCSILLETGEMVHGANQENAAYPAGICAEGTALSTASSLYSGQAIVKLGIAYNSGKNFTTPLAPCGICRQQILEAEKRHGQKIEILLQSENGVVFQFDSIESLLPFPFTEF